MSDLYPSLTIGPHGVIHGKRVLDSRTGKAKAERFAGVPYALPPLGSRRFTKPQALPSQYKYASADRSNCSEFQPPCYQPSSYGVKTDTGEQQPAEPAPQTEDCLYLNIWRPLSTPPSKGWPILFSIHGGWLQIGSPHQDPSSDYSDLIAPREQGGAGFECVVVCPAYRLNVFGFLACDDLDGSTGKGNFGFWDQRMALEWTVENAKSIGGDPEQITIAGISAGAQSAHAQLLYEFSRAQMDASFKPYIKRCLLRSGTAMLPGKCLFEASPQVKELCGMLGISAYTDAERVEALRSVPAADLVSVIPRMQMHTFRGVRDGGIKSGGFVDSDWNEKMADDSFAKWCNRQGISFAFGELADEAQEYRLINAPSVAPLKNDFLRQLHNYYPMAVVERLRDAYDVPDDTIENPEVWADAFGQVTADAQIYTAQRLFESCLKSLPPSQILRYRIERRAAVLDDLFPKAKGVFHGTDGLIYVFAMNIILTAANQEEAKKDLTVFLEWLEPFKAWMEGKSKGIGYANGIKMRVMRSNGHIELIDDPLAKPKESQIQALREAITLASSNIPSRYIG